MSDHTNMPLTIKEIGLCKYCFQTLLLLAVLLVPPANAENLAWMDLPHIGSLASTDQMIPDLADLHAKSEYSLLVIVGNLVFGNPCASLGVGGRSGAAAIGGASGTTNVSGASGLTSVGGVAGQVKVGGASRDTSVQGRSSTTNVGGASSTASVAGASQATGISGTSGRTKSSGVTNTLEVSGASGRPMCARTRDQLDYVLSVPVASEVFEYDGQGLYEIPATKIVAKKK